MGNYTKMSYDFDTIVDRRITGSIKYANVPEGQLPFTIADSDFLVAPAIQKALVDRTSYRLYGYARPPREFNESFLQWFARTYNQSLREEWLVPLPGIVPALAVAAKVRDGKCITNVPNYGMLLSGPKRAGKELIAVPMKYTVSDDNIEYYEFDFARLEAAVTEDTDIFYLCNPHNPVGRVYTREELQQVSDFARRHNLVVVSDEIHCEILFDRAHIPFHTVDDYAREHSITFTAPGKTYSIPGIGGAFAIIPNAELRERFQAEGYALGRPNAFGVAAMIAAYRDCDDWKQELVAYLRENRDYLENEVRRRFPKARQTHTQGTYLGWIDFGAYTGSGPQEKWIAKQAQVLFHGAEFFYGEQHIRWNFAAPRALLTEALDRLQEAFDRAEK